MASNGAAVRERIEEREIVAEEYMKCATGSTGFQYGKRVLEKRTMQYV